MSQEAPPSHEAPYGLGPAHQTTHAGCPVQHCQASLVLVSCEPRVELIAQGRALKGGRHGPQRRGGLESDNESCPFPDSNRQEQN